MAGETVLIVDDTPINLKLTRLLLSRDGFETRVAASAEEAIEILAGYHPMAVLADIQLPGMDGLELTRRIKAAESTKHIAVLALSALATPEDERRAREAGCDAYITKPIDTRALGPRIRQVLNAAPSASPSAAHSAPAPAVEDLEQLRRRFLDSASDLAGRMLNDLDNDFSPDEARRVAHQWVGTGGLLGFAVISRMARSLETLLGQKPLDAAEVRDAIEEFIRELAHPSVAGTV